MKRYLALLAILFSTSPAHMAETPRVSYRIDTVAGGGLTGEGGPAVEAQLGTVQGIALDRSGNLYLSDTDHHCVRKVDASGAITTIAGTGVAGFLGDGGPATEAHLNLPYGLAVDRDGAVYIADLGNNRVRRIGPDGIIATVAGTGERGSAGDQGPAAAAQLLTPRNVALDANGNLFFSEFEGHRVRRVLPDGRIVTVAGTGTAGLRGDGGPGALAQLGFPAGLAFDAAGALYIADSQNQRVRKLSPGGTISTVLGGSVLTPLYTPLAVTVDAAGTVLVGDASNTVRAYSLAGAWSRVAGTGAQGFSGDAGAAVSALLEPVRDLALDPAGRLYIATGPRVRRVDGEGRIDTVAGDGYQRFIGDGASALTARLAAPSAVALDYSGNLNIADAGTQRVRQVNASGVIRTLAGTGTAGTFGLNSPMGVAVDPSGVTLIADTNNHRIRAVTALGYVSTLAGTGAAGAGAENLAWTQTALREPQGVCTDRRGVVYIVDTGNHRVLRAAPGTGMAAAAGNGSAGDAGDGGPARLAQLNRPSACALDSAGNLFIADTGNHRVRKVAPNGTIATAAGTGVGGSAGDNGPATAGQLNAPRGVAVDDNGNLFIADTGNHAIRQVGPDGAIHIIAGRGTAGFAGDGGPAAEALLNSPAGLLLDGAGDLYVADSGNNRVRRLMPMAGALADPVTEAARISVVNAASLREGPVAPGEVVTILGSGLGPESGLSAEYDASGRVPTRLSGVEVRFGGAAVPLFYVQAGQVNAQAPYSLAGGRVTVEVIYRERVAGSAQVDVAATAPAIFPVVVNQDGSINLETVPAARGGVVTLFATGEGLREGENVDGAAAAPEYPKPRGAVVVTISGAPAVLEFAAAAPGMVGILQVNARVPRDGLAAGRQTLHLAVGGNVSPAIDIWLK